MNDSYKTLQYLQCLKRTNKVLDVQICILCHVDAVKVLDGNNIMAENHYFAIVAG